MGIGAGHCYCLIYKAGCWLHEVTHKAGVEAGTGTNVSYLSQGCKPFQGAGQSTQLLISHLPHAANHEHKYFVGILSPHSLCTRHLLTLCLFSAFLVTSNPVQTLAFTESHPSRVNNWIFILSFSKLERDRDRERQLSCCCNVCTHPSS